jgi:hypothetical protein
MKSKIKFEGSAKTGSYLVMGYDGELYKLSRGIKSLYILLKPEEIFYRV